MKDHKYGAPVIVVLSATVVNVLKEDERVQKVKEEKVIAEQREILNDAKWRFEEAQERLLQAQKDIEETKKVLLKNK
jgi:hypothetical protein